jgi:type II secretory pathway component PulF
MDWILVAWPTLFLLGLGLRMALRLCYGARGPSLNDPIYDFISLVSWVLIGMGVIPAALVSMFSFFGLIVVFIAAVSLVEFVTQHRAALRRSVCSLLATYLERKMHFDASALLSTYAMRGRVGRAARKLFAALDAGVPLPLAIAENERALPPSAIAYVASGGTIQAEAAALKELNRNEDREVTAVWRSCVDRASYLSCVLIVLMLVMTFVMIKIVPAFQSIFDEFQMELPRITELAVAVSNSFAEYFAAPTFLFLLVVLAVALITGILHLFDVPILQGLSDRLFRDRSNAGILRILALAAEQRQPLTPVLDRLATVYPSSIVRARVERAAASVRAGDVWQDALTRERLARPAEAALLKSAEQTGNLPWALRNVADRRERRSIYRLTVALQVLYPIVIILLGCLVGFYVVSLFVPVVKLIESLV